MEFAFINGDVFMSNAAEHELTKQFNTVIKDHTNGMHPRRFCAVFWGTYRRKQEDYQEQALWWIDWMINNN